MAIKGPIAAMYISGRNRMWSKGPALAIKGPITAMYISAEIECGLKAQDWPLKAQ